MKKILFSLLAIVGMAFAANAQKAEITASYGGYTIMDACDYHDGWSGVNNAWGALNVGVNFKIAPKFMIGPSYTFSSATTKGGKNHSNVAYHVIMLNGKYQYYSNSIVKLYAKLGVGADISHMQPRQGDSYNRGYFAFQLTPIGATVDINKTFGVFGELGFGAQGLLQVGVKVNLL